MYYLDCIPNNCGFSLFTNVITLVTSELLHTNSHESVSF